MQFANVLEELLGRKSKIKILRFLLKTYAEMNGREIARNTGLDHKTCHQVLKELSTQGVVIANNTSSGILYKLNDKNVLVKRLLKPLFTTERDLIKTISEFISERINFKINTVILFGSLIRGEESPISDVDILFIIPDEVNADEIEKEISSWNDEFISNFSNMLSPIILTFSEFTERLQAKDKLMVEIARTGKIIYGEYPV